MVNSFMEPFDDFVDCTNALFPSQLRRNLSMKLLTDELGIIHTSFSNVKIPFEV